MLIWKLCRWFSTRIKQQKCFSELTTVIYVGISGYIIEKCEVGSDRWAPVGGYCPSTQFTVRNLDEGKKYKFRVKAETVHGVSEPLEGKPVVAKNPFGKPRFAALAMLRWQSSLKIIGRFLFRCTRCSRHPKSYGLQFEIRRSRMDSAR